MTIVHAIVVSATLVALLMMVRYFRRARTRQGAAVDGAATNLDVELPRPSYGNFLVSSHAGARSERQTLSAPPSEQVGSSEVPRSHRSLSRKRHPIRARLAMLSVGSFDRTASRHRAPRGYEEARVDMPDGSPATARQIQHDEQFRSTLELLPFAVLMTDQHCQIVLANAATAELFGYSHDELIGAPADVLVPALRTHFHATQPTDITLARPVRAAGRGHDLVARRKDGKQFPAEITANPILSNGESYTLTVVVDRTDRYELQRNRQELAHLTRVSTLGELAGSLAHELNQPLTAILSNAQAAQRFLATQPINLAEMREILQDLVNDNHRASEVLRKIRALVKKGEFEAAALSLASVVGDVALLVHSDAIVRGIRMCLNIAPQLPSIYGDKVQLQQVVLNLLLNAFEALESRSAHDRVVMVEATLDGAEMILVAVRDRGPGLASDKLDKLFMPFFTSKREGLGLGLSISRSIVEMHGGRIWAENNEDQGATFYFTLPTGAAPECARARQQP
jgi:two-component system sensor kinase FixL